MSEPTEPPCWYDGPDPCNECGEPVRQKGENGYWDLHDGCES